MVRRPIGTQKEFRPGSLSECSVLCYATSRDGVHWDRPQLGLHEVMGTRQNNVVIGDDHHNGLAHWESVLKDPLEADPERRYKALRLVELRLGRAAERHLFDDLPGRHALDPHAGARVPLPSATGQAKTSARSATPRA